MKTLLTVLTLITMSSFNNSFIDLFDEQVNDAYDEYRVLDDYSNSYYTIKIVYGLMNNQVRYGVCFYSEVSKDYHLNILYNNKLYALEKNSRGDISAVAISLKPGDVFSVVIYDKNDRYQYVERFQNIQIMEKDEFEVLDLKIVGNGLGGSLTKLKAESKLSIQGLFIIAFASVIFFCLFIIFLFYRKHRGMFAEEVRIGNVFNFKEFVNSTFENHTDHSQSQEEMHGEDNLIDNGKYLKTHYQWSHYEEETSGFDIKQHLQDKGFIFTYKLASEDEKNLIMLELMRLRDEGIITKDDYLEETSELWKK